MMLSILGIVLFLSYCTCAQQPFFRKGYVYSPEQQSFYKLQTTGLNWTEANHSCKIEGATLAVPKDASEADYLINLVSSGTSNTIYIGLQDILSEGVYTTVEGALLADVYQKWATGEPKSGNTTNCVTLDTKGYMSVISCDTVLPYVCKKTLATLEWNAACNLPDMDYTYVAEQNKCYKFHLNPQTWTEAFRVCIAEESYLTVLNSDQEASAIANITNAAPKDTVTGNYLRGAILLGFHNKFLEGYETIFGETLQEAGYALWGPGQPDSANGQAELCGSMFYELEKNTTTVYLNDIGCDAWNCFFICEHDLSPQNVTIDSRLEGLIQ